MLKLGEVEVRSPWCCSLTNLALIGLSPFLLLVFNRTKTRRSARQKKRLSLPFRINLSWSRSQTKDLRRRRYHRNPELTLDRAGNNLPTVSYYLSRLINGPVLRIVSQWISMSIRMLKLAIPSRRKARRFLKLKLNQRIKMLKSIVQLLNIRRNLFRVRRKSRVKTLIITCMIYLPRTAHFCHPTSSGKFLSSTVI